MFKNMFCMSSAFVMCMIHFFSSFGALNGIGLPLELLHEGVNGGKSMDFARRLNFPLAHAANDVELPPNVEDNMEVNAPKAFDTASMEDNDNLEDDLPIKSEIPKWLQLQQQREAHQHANYHHSNMLTKHAQSGKHHTESRQVHNVITSSAAASPLRRCSIEISNKIPGICQAMGTIGNACISGDYVDVFNAECL